MKSKDYIKPISITAEDIASLTFYQPLPWLFRIDVLPFAFIYMTIGYITLTTGFNQIFFGFAVCLHLIILFLSLWSVKFKCFLQYSKIDNWANASIVKVQKTIGSGSLCSLIRNKKVVHSSDFLPLVSFCFEKVDYALYEKDKDYFKKLEYPIHKEIHSYLDWKGYSSEKEIENATIHWGLNIFHVPIPAFIELFKEHAIAPFFVFQVFCMLLWSLDEYWYYSVFTLIMLISFECTVVKQRQSNMQILQNMRRPPEPFYVYRLKQWKLISSDHFVPGDIISLKRKEKQEESLVPCDLLLLSGNCVVSEAMLSGESVPKRKEAITSIELNKCLDPDDQHKLHVIFGGTKILQYSLSENNKKTIPKPPDGGLTCYVLRTAFGSVQGNLMRKILFASERVTVNSKETLCFLLILVFFAIIAAYKVLKEGLADEGRNPHKLILHCILIITSVIPPELPMELSLAVTNSLIALSRLGIFCTEPYRIPNAGKVDICCFDKTGTLTTEDFCFCGVSGVGKTQDDALEIKLPHELDREMIYCIAGCHSLIQLDGKTLGDPLEKVSIESIQWTLGRDDSSVVPPPFSSYNDEKLCIIQRFAFSSELKRMSTLVNIKKNEKEMFYILTKGAPETLELLFDKVPPHYRDTFQYFTRQGFRILAMGQRQLTDSLSTIRFSTRENLEKKLNFCGFLVFDAPLKDDSKKIIRNLMHSSHRVVMITGDNPLTACSIGKQIGILKKPALLLTSNNKSENNVFWEPLDLTHQKETIAYSIKTLNSLSRDFNLCVVDESLANLKRNLFEGKNWNSKQKSFEYQKYLKQFCPNITIFARTSPSLKEKIITALNSDGYITSMCGDGTNDIGALKQAHVGISVVNSISHQARFEKKQELNAQKSKPRNMRNRKVKDKHENNLQQMELIANQQMPLVKLADASIASPFTSRSSSVQVVEWILIQGRCTLVTTLQMFKILGVNCLTSAYMLSILYSHGVKQGDQQMTIFGMMIAIFFFLLSRTKPANTLSKERPASSVFSPSIIFSIIGQFFIHLYCLTQSVELAFPYLDLNDPALHPDGKFTENILNSVVFIITSNMQVSTFLVNYNGHPFMQSLKENKVFLFSTLITYFVLALATMEIFPFGNEILQLSPFPSFEFKKKLMSLLLLDTISVFLYEWILQKLCKLSFNSKT